MNELQTIRDALELGHQLAEDHAFLGICSKTTEALAALSRLEALAAEMPDVKAIIKAIRTGNLSEAEAGALIGHYARLYSEDIRKDRDEWKQLSMDLAVIAAEKIGIKLTYK